MYTPSIFFGGEKSCPIRMIYTSIEYLSSLIHCTKSERAAWALF